MKLAECWEGGIKKHLIFLHRKGFKLVSAVAVLRGGNWNNGANAGPFSANLNNAPTNTNNNIGFRCCRAPETITQTSRSFGRFQVQRFALSSCKMKTRAETEQEEKPAVSAMKKWINLEGEN